jgi:myo-inositol 2-dehydrogenase/D-chiro-inositol 1-dehydrogenase
MPNTFDIRVYDIVESSAAKFAQSMGVTHLKDWDSIFSDDVDGVIICTPPETHYELISKALTVGINVFCEKPLCNTLDEAKAIIDLEKKVNKFVQVGYVYRYVEDYIRLKKLLSEPEQPLGKPLSAILRIGGRGSHQLWKHLKSENGGVVSEMLVHMIDLAQWLFGDLTEFKVHKSELLSPERLINGVQETVDADDFIVATAKSSSGARVLFQADMITPAFRQYLEYQGSEGNFVGSIQKEYESYIFLNSPFAEYQAGKNSFEDEPVNLFQRQMETFIENIKSGRLKDGANTNDTYSILKILNT